MADITVRGYCNRPEKKSVNGKTVSTFSLSETYKDKKTNTKTYGFYNCTLWEKDPPDEGSYVEMSGRLKQRQYEKDGQKRVSLDVTVNTLTMNPPKREAGTPAAGQAGANAKDEFEF